MLAVGAVMADPVDISSGVDFSRWGRGADSALRLLGGRGAGSALRLLGGRGGGSALRLPPLDAIG